MKPIELSCLLLSGAALSGALLLGGLSASAHAASPSQPAPVKESVLACQGKKAGDTVDLKVGKNKTAKAVCKMEKGQLVAQRSASVGP